MGLLEGLVAAAGSVALASLLLWTALFSLSTPGPFTPLMLAPVMFATVIAGIVAGCAALLNLPLTLLAALRFGGPLAVALILGALLGAAEVYVLPSRNGDAILLPLGAIAGAAFAWRVWVRCVAPRRAARAGKGP
jgi:hypothetical protein